MTALRLGLAAAAGLSLCCARTLEARRHTMPPPARAVRAGASPRSAGPASAVGASLAAREGQGAGGPEVASGASLAEALDALSSLVGHREVVLSGVDHGAGCLALARAAFAARGRPLEREVRDVPALRTRAVGEDGFARSRRPAVGDLVFLADQPGGAAEHVGVVDRVDSDDTAFVLQRGARGVLRFRMNLAYPTRANDPSTGRHINDLLLVGARPQPAGSLVVGLSDLLRR